MVWDLRLIGDPGGPTSITGTARIVLATFYVTTLSFQDTPPNADFDRVAQTPPL